MDCMLKRFVEENYSPIEAPTDKGDRLNKDHTPKNDIEFKSMKNNPYASLIESLMYAQDIRPDKAFAPSVHRRYRSNLGL